MEDVTFTLPASWDYLKEWLQRFVVEEHPPAGVTSCSLELLHHKEDSRKFLWLPERVRDEFVLAIVGAYRGSVTLPLVEFTVLTDRGTCRVMARCNEHGLTGYFRGLLLAVVEQWPSTQQALEEYAYQLPVTVETDPGWGASPLPSSHRMEASIVKYRNFDLEAFEYKRTGTTERFSVRVMHSPVGEQHQTDAEARVLPSDLRQKLRALDKRGLTFSEMVELGKVLADLLFPASVRGFLDRSREKLAKNEGLRVRLKLDQYALVDLPWEYVYLPSPGTSANYQGADGFLVLDRGISLVRYEILGQAPGVLDPVSGRAIRLVALSASPKEVGLATLNLAAEQQNIEQALKDLNGIQVEYYPDATIATLLDAVAHDVHIFHFAGHGKFEGDLGAAYGTIEGQGYLLLTNAAGQPARLSGEKLAINLKGRGIRLAILGACEGGRRDEINPWTGVAPALTKASIPAVVGMQYTIRDANAIAFSRQFYRALAASQPIDAAVTEGRLAIFNQTDDDERDWGVPVLYLRAEEEGVLFPKSAGNGTRRNGVATGTGPKTRQALPSRGDIDPVALRQAIVKRYGPPDSLETVCQIVEQRLKDDGIELQVNLAIVGGGGLQAQALYLIQYLDRRSYLPYLVAALRDDAPDTNW